MKIFLIHQYSGNKGDRAVLYAMCRMISDLYSGAEITVATSDAKLWNNYEYYKKNNIRFVPWAWDYIDVKSKNPYWKLLNRFKKYTFTIFRESILRKFTFIGSFLINPQFRQVLKSSDVVISVGGHHFTTILSRDLVSGINFDSMAVMSENKKMICFSQSFGPFDFHNTRNKELTQLILGSAYLMPREERSKLEVIQLLNNKRIPILTYESVLSLSQYIKFKHIEQRDNCVGIAIYCTQYRTQQDKNAYQETIANFCNHVIKKGFAVKFFPMEIKGSGPDDRPFIAGIISKVKESDKCSAIDADLETLDHLNEVSKCKVFVGHKTHSTIFALATGTPLIGIAYHTKTIEFLKQFNIESNVIDDKNLTSNLLCSTFDRISLNLEQIGRKEYETALNFTAIIKKDFTKAIEQIK